MVRLSVHLHTNVGTRGRRFLTPLKQLLMCLLGTVSPIFSTGHQFPDTLVVPFSTATVDAACLSGSMGLFFVCLVFLVMLDGDGSEPK